MFPNNTHPQITKQETQRHTVTHKERKNKTYETITHFLRQISVVEGIDSQAMCNAYRAQGTEENNTRKSDSRNTYKYF